MIGLPIEPGLFILYRSRIFFFLAGQLFFLQKKMSKHKKSGCQERL
jgi:hypothetical protein